MRLVSRVIITNMCYYHISCPFVQRSASRSSDPTLSELDEVDHTIRTRAQKLAASEIPLFIAIRALKVGNHRAPCKPPKKET